MSDAALLELARGFVPRLRLRSAEIEASRHLPADIVDGLARAGFFHLCVPRVIGGLEVAPGTLLQVIEAIARGDAAAGWCVMIGTTTGLMAAYLEEDVAREVYG